MSAITFDKVFMTWLQMEIGNAPDRDMLALAKSKGFNSITEWRLATALRMGLDTREWSEVIIDDPNQALPQVIIGPYKGWSIHFDNQLNTSFEQALEIPAFFDWCKTHNRIPSIAQNFPFGSTVILLQTPDGKMIHVEGGHRICAIAYAKKIGQPIDFKGKPPIKAYVAKIPEDEIPKLQSFLKQGTGK
jgi:hypothetical protein